MSEWQGRLEEGVDAWVGLIVPIVPLHETAAPLIDHLAAENTSLEVLPSRNFREQRTACQTLAPLRLPRSLVVDNNQSPIVVGSTIERSGSSGDWRSFGCWSESTTAAAAAAADSAVDAVA